MFTKLALRLSLLLNFALISSLAVGCAYVLGLATEEKKWVNKHKKAFETEEPVTT